jgi:2-C-methyl-D-erythritol 4-phosphate cytidylyltransferase
MVVHAVRALLGSGLVERVTVLAGDASQVQLERACSAEPVSVSGRLPHRVGVHVTQRSTGTRSDGVITDRVGGVVLLHDACRPLAPVALVSSVVDAVLGGHDLAVPVLPLTDTVKRVDDRGLVTGTPDRSTLRVLQTPVAVRPELLPADLGDDPLEVVRRHTAAGATAHCVPGHPAAFPVRTAWDLELAELVAEGTIAL